MLQWEQFDLMYQWNKNSLDAGEASCVSVLWSNQDLYSLTCADVMDGIMLSQNLYVELNNSGVSECHCFWIWGFYRAF